MYTDLIRRAKIYLNDQDINKSQFDKRCDISSRSLLFTKEQMIKYIQLLHFQNQALFKYIKNNKKTSTSENNYNTNNTNYFGTIDVAYIPIIDNLTKKDCEQIDLFKNQLQDIQYSLITFQNIYNQQKLKNDSLSKQLKSYEQYLYSFRQTQTYQLNFKKANTQIYSNQISIQNKILLKKLQSQNNQEIKYRNSYDQDIDKKQVEKQLIQNDNNKMNVKQQSNKYANQHQNSVNFMGEIAMIQLMKGFQNVSRRIQEDSMFTLQYSQSKTKSHNRYNEKNGSSIFFSMLMKSQHKMQSHLQDDQSSSLVQTSSFLLSQYPKKQKQKSYHLDNVHSTSKIFQNALPNIIEMTGKKQSQQIEDQKNQNYQLGNKQTNQLNFNLIKQQNNYILHNLTSKNSDFKIQTNSNGSNNFFRNQFQKKQQQQNQQSSSIQSSSSSQQNSSKNSLNESIIKI